MNKEELSKTMAGFYMELKQVDVETSKIVIEDGCEKMNQQYISKFMIWRYFKQVQHVHASPHGTQRPLLIRWCSYSGGTEHPPGHLKDGKDLASEWFGFGLEHVASMNIWMSMNCSGDLKSINMRILRLLEIGLFDHSHETCLDAQRRIGFRIPLFNFSSNIKLLYLA